MYEVFLTNDGGDPPFRHHSFHLRASSAERQRQALESEGKEALWLDMGLSARTLFGWLAEQARRIPWWVWILLI
jgi:hypothetical protein